MPNTGSTTASGTTAGATYSAPGVALADIEAAVAAQLSMVVGTAADLALIDQAITIAGQAAVMYKFPWWWAMSRTTFSTVAQASVSKVARSSNVATITTSAAHGLIAGCTTRVSGVTTTGFNNTWAVVVSAPSTTTFTYANAGSDVVETADATGKVVTFGFPLRTVNSNAMQDLYAIQAAWFSTTTRMESVPWNSYIEWHTTQASTATGDPWKYAVNGDPPSMYFWSLPTTASTITLRYLKRHSKITSASSSDAALIVPAEWHYPIYVDGAIYVIRNRKFQPQALYQNPVFVSALENMWTSRPEDQDLNSSSRGASDLPSSLPADRHVFISGGPIDPTTLT